MLNDIIIVQTAASAFNNAALAAPAFLWWGILALPLFWITYFCATPIMTRIGWTRENINSRATLLTVILSLAWLIMFGGNWAVLRDGVSLLPWLIATILFVGSIFITSNIKIPVTTHRGRRALLILLVIIGLGLSGMHAWWGPLLQIGAPIAGIIVGRMARAPMRPIAGTLLIILTITTAIMMQPEFFRFGKLGELTLAHMCAILMVGMFAMATLALNNVTPRGRIHKSAYVKLKWMLRFVAALGVALMFLTESVPVFLGTLAVLLVMFALSVWHANSIAPNLTERMFALTIGTFGIITTMPAITAIAILYWHATASDNTWRDGRTLL